MTPQKVATFNNIVALGGHLQEIKPKTWTKITAGDRLIAEAIMVRGRTHVAAWVSFDNQSPTVHTRQFRTDRNDGTKEGDFTARDTAPVSGLVRDIGLTYTWELFSDGIRALSVEFWHDATGSIFIESEVHLVNVLLQP